MVEVGPLSFSSKARAVEHVRAIKDRTSPGNFLSGEDAAVVLGALQRHPDCASKVGLGVRRIGVFANGETRSGAGFGVERVDGTVARFSYKVCFSGEKRSNADRAREAFRQAVRSAILRWRDNTFSKHGGHIQCAITNELVNPQACHVDHEKPGFSDILGSFLAQEGIRIDEVRIEVSDGEQVEAVLSDKDFRTRWVRHHNKNVRLRILSVEGHRIHHGNI